MPKYGLLIDYEFCIGCHACEIACAMEHNLPPGKWGIKVVEFGPQENAPGKWEITYIPYPTELCDLCADRTGRGKLPSCVHHCEAAVMEFGTIEELSQKITKPKMLLWVPK